MKKRVLSLVLALVMLIGVLPVNMLAAEPVDELPAQQTVTIETSLDSALADGVYAAAQSPLPVSIRAEADGEAVEHTASLDGEVLTGTQAADGWTAYELSFEAAGSYTLTGRGASGKRPGADSGRRDPGRGNSGRRDPGRGAQAGAQSRAADSRAEQRQ